MTSAEPSGRPSAAPDAALYDAVATEHGIIYGYGVAAAHDTAELNDMVSSLLDQHRKRREAAIEMLDGRSLPAPLPAVGYRLPIPVRGLTDVATLGVQMEQDSAVAWRAVLEQATAAPDRAFAVTALTQSAVAAARWRTVLDLWPVTVAFPGGTE